MHTHAHLGVPESVIVHFSLRQAIRDHHGSWYDRELANRCVLLQDQCLFLSQCAPSARRSRYVSPSDVRAVFALQAHNAYFMSFTMRFCCSRIWEKPSHTPVSRRVCSYNSAAQATYELLLRSLVRHHLVVLGLVGNTQREGRRGSGMRLLVPYSP